MGKKSGSAGDKAKFGAYKATNRAVVNAKRKIERHLKKHPEDAQAQAALKNVATKKLRAKPGNKGGWVTESLRSTMVYIPYLTGKGSPIALKAPEQVEAMLRLYGQGVALTKTNTKGYAQMLKFTKVSAFYQVPVVEVKKVKGQEVATTVWKHTSKESNYQGPAK